MEASWLLALITSPLFFNIYSSRVFEPDKIALVRSLALVALAAWLVKLVADGGPRFDVLPARRLSVPLLIPVAALVVAYLIATALSISPSISLWGSYQRLQGTFTTFSYIVLALAVAANLRRRSQLERIITVVVITSLPVSGYGILQRFKLDPLPWGGDTIERVTGPMGNAIFLAAYLIMAAMLVLGRVVQSFRAVMTSSTRLAVHTLRAAIYVFILAINLVAIWFTQSRGPQLGLLAGMFFFFVLLALYYRVRWLVLTTVALGAVMAVFLVVLNVPNGPLRGLAQTRGVNRLAGIFEEIQGNSGTGRVRVLIWTGVVEMVSPHAPLETPDGRPDIWNSLRPLVGYGPEAMLVGYNRFYPPELGQLEARNASPDRSHNETFDALAFTGILGLLAQMSLFVGIFYYSLKWLGLIGSPARRNVFFLLVIGGGVSAAAGFMAWQGPQFLGVSLPFGMLLGLILFLTLYALLPAVQQAPRREAWQAVALISLFSAVVAHFAEIHFGIAIVSTRTHFWIFLGLLIVLGEVWPRLEASAAGPLEPAAAGAAQARTAGRGTRRRGAALSAPAAAEAPLLPVALTLGIMAPILLTLGFDFITNSSRNSDVATIISSALTVLPSAAGPQLSLGILGLVALTWLMGGVTVYLEETADQATPGLGGGLAVSLALTALATGLAWLIFAGLLAGVAVFQPTSVDQLKQSVEMVAALLSWYYGMLFVALLAWAALLAAARPAPARGRGELPAGPLLAAIGLPLVAVWLSTTLNLQVIQADMIYKTGLQFDDQGQSAVAIELFKETLSMAPSQDFYYLFLGRAYLNASNTAPAEQRNGLFETAQTELLKARDLNPLNTDHSANLARLNRQWAILATDEAVRQDRVQQADMYYGQAVKLSPNNAGLWNEWGLLLMQQIGDLGRAQTSLEKSLALDDKFDQTFWYLGDLYQAEARGATDAAVQQNLFQQAEAAYRKGVAIGEAGRATSLLNLHLGLANVYVATNQLKPAIDQYLQVAQLNAGGSQWQVYRALGELYRQSGDMEQAKRFGQEALTAAPDPEKPGLQAWLNVISP